MPREGVQARLNAWVEAHILRLLQPLILLRRVAEAKADGLAGLGRGLAFQLAESLGSIERNGEHSASDLHRAGRALRPFGVRIGRRSIFIPRLLKPAPAALAALLWAVHARLPQIPALPAAGLTSFAIDAASEPDFLAAAFYRVVGERAVRLDILERVEETLAASAHDGRDAKEAVPALASLLGCANADVVALAAALGWRKSAAKAPAREVWRRKDSRRDASRRPARARQTSTDSPFAELAALIPAD